MIKIKKIKFYNDKIFGNQEFDFTFEDGRIANNIIIAGENGVGKTKLLEHINWMLSNTYYLGNKNITNKLYELLIDISDEDYYAFDDKSKKIEEVLLIISPFRDGVYNYYAIIEINEKRLSTIKHSDNPENMNYINFNSIYSSVDINYNPKNNIDGITNKTLDESFSNLPQDMAKEIIQLLIDIASQDSHELDSWVGKNKGVVPPEEIYHKRMSRFTTAFESIFGDKLIYDSIKNNTIPIFKKNNKEIEISQLSSGEKQIIFRGTYLLRNKNSLKGLPILIDEPEISMHPLWEDNIFDYYNKLFVFDDIQTSQMFVATHSEHILSNVLKRDDSLVIKMTLNESSKYHKNCIGEVLPTITIAEVKYLIFDLYTIDFHTLLYGHIQNTIITTSDGHIPNIYETDQWLKNNNVTIKEYDYVEKGYHYDTLQSYIRNCIDHPDYQHEYSQFELKESINEMINIIKNNSN